MAQICRILLSDEILDRSNWIDSDSYTVFPLNLESPDEGPHTQVDDPASSASPFGWHDTNGTAGAEFTDTRGNNVFAQDDTDANNSGGIRPSGGAGLDFNDTLDLGQPPSTQLLPAITNLFYWNNILHDVFYEYGFDEASGNFQENNYGNGGLGSDAVNADAQ
ncbi:MAG: M36 family metallopeptidase, partial [Planctomycetes bacterium]|nr:M36 family metallopeptidase [Planctomycetota bacterium]